MFGPAVWLIARHVFKESVRDKVLYNLVFFAILLIAASYLVGQLSGGEEVKIIKDLGLAAMAIFGLFIAVFIGIGLVFKEVERRSIYALLAKPVRRAELVAGKFLGLGLTLGINLAIMTAALYAVLAGLVATQPESARLAWEAPGLDPALIKPILLIYVELLLVTGIALFFSTFSTPMLSATLTFGLYVIGHFNADLRHFEQVVDSPAAASLARALYYLLPNFAAFDIKSPVVHGQAVPWVYLGLTAGYGIAYVAGLLLAAVLIFSRRDLK